MRTRTYSDTTEKTLVTFQISGGGGNRRRVEFVEQDTDIGQYIGDDHCVSYENEDEISRLIGDRENLMNLFEQARDHNDEAKSRIEKYTGIEFGNLIYIRCASRSPVGLNVTNDGTGIIDDDGDYDTTIVRRLEDCSDDELLLIYESPNYKSSDVEVYCKNRLLEANMIFDEEE